MALQFLIKITLLLLILTSVSLTWASIPPEANTIGSANCWGSLMELQSCTGEVIQFFYEEKANLGAQCCLAIRVIGRNCWSSMLTALGFTSQEGAILTDYCDSQDDPPIN